jgi:demethylmenaquinone methyltransferase/2-methoxy-6-polyprenyl-1,4-benzoquinol methylase
MADPETPYAEKEKVRQMFNDIAPRYDLLNTLLSAGIHKRWRRKVRKIVQQYKPKQVLDVATGTGDLAILAARLRPTKVTGVDISPAMLELAVEKTRKKRLDHLIEFRIADAADLPFEDGAFDLAMVGFGVRNFESPAAGLTEIRRVLRPGGTLIVLEFSEPLKTWRKKLYGFYFRRILPGVGRLISGSRGAYHYLPESVGRFPAREAFTSLLSQCGFRNATWKELNRGIACLYVCEK